MLFNLDRNFKQSILAEYKKEALLYQQKRQQEKQQKIKEEQEYLKQINKREEESLEKLKREEAIKKNNQLKYYQQAIANTPNKNLRKKELIIKNWGLNRNQSIPYNDKNIFRKEAIINKYEVDYNSLSPEQKQKIYIRKGEDHMNRYLTDEQNKDETSKFFREEKLYRQKYYKDLVNSQYEEAQRINKDRYGTNDILIVERERKKYFNDNNYMNGKRYDFGKSNLLHNPIVNPENNLGYNKYINLRLSKSNIFKNTLDINNKNLNDINNNINPSLTIPQEKHESNKRILNIKQNFNNEEGMKDKLYCQSETNELNNNTENKEDNNIKNNMKLGFNNYGRFSNDNIFEYRKNVNNNINEKRIFSPNKYNNQSTSKGSILSQAAKSNFLI